MSLKELLLVATALAATTVSAQSAIGTVTSVNGVVTATHGSSGMAAAAGAPIQSGTRFVTTSNGSVALRLNNGCQVTVPAGHAVTVMSNMTCQQLTAAIQPVSVPTAVMGQSGASNVGVVNGVVVAGAILIAAGIIQIEADDDDAPVSGR